MPLPADLLALLNACRADPVGDLPRLVLADWLDEHDDPARAEFLRVQCELARPSLDTERIATLKLRERALIDANWRAWAGGLHAVCCDLIDAEARQRYADAAEQTTPRLIDAGPLGEAPQVARDDPFLAGLPWKFTRGLTQLTVTPERLTSPSLGLWSLTSEVGWMESLRLPLRDSEFAAFGSAVVVPRDLASRFGIELNLSDSSVLGVSCLYGCTRWVSWRHIRRLTITGRDYNSGFLTLLRPAKYTGLGYLIINGVDLAPIAAELCRKELTRLVSLDVSTTYVPLETLLAFAKRTPRLNVLIAWRTPLGDPGFAALVATSWGETLHRLEVMNCDLGDDAMTSLVESGLLGRLYGPQLNLSMNRVADAGLATLADSEDLLRFGELILRENRVGDAGVEALAASPFVANLRYLDLWKNRLTDRGAAALAGSPHLGQLRDLNVRDNLLTNVGRALLTERYGAVAKVGF